MTAQNCHLRTFSYKNSSCVGWLCTVCMLNCKQTTNLLNWGNRRNFVIKTFRAVTLVKLSEVALRNASRFLVNRALHMFYHSWGWAYGNSTGCEFIDILWPSSGLTIMRSCFIQSIAEKIASLVTRFWSKLLIKVHARLTVKIAIDCKNIAAWLPSTFHATAPVCSWKWGRPCLLS